MIYSLIKDPVLHLLRCPLEAPEPPAGSHASVVVFRAAPAFLRYRLLGALGKVLGMSLFEIWGVVLLLQVPQAGSLAKMAAGLILAIAAFKALAIYVTTRLDYDMRFYIITDRSLRIREGVWIIRETTFTFENIQNLRIAQGPVQRIFGISDLVVVTAGGGGATPGAEGEQQASAAMHRAAFRGLGRPAQLRDQIFAYLRRAANTGLGDRDERHPAARPRPSGGFTDAEIEALRALRDETRQWREALAAN